MAANLIAFLLAGTVCALSGRLTIRNDGDYGPYGGDGPWFALTIDSDVQGDVQLASHCWIVPDGEYRGTLDPDDRSLLCLPDRGHSDLKPGDASVLDLPARSGV